MEDIKRTASQLQDVATFLYEELEECETQEDVEEKGFDISGSIDEIERCLAKIKNNIGI